MKAMLLASAGAWLGLAAGAVHGQADSFPFEKWSSADGKSIEAQLIKAEGDTVTLRRKNGGKRFEVKREQLSKESLEAIESYRKRVRGEIESGEVGTTTIYQATVLGLGAEAAAALAEKKLFFAVTEIRLDSDRQAAWLGLNKGIFMQVFPPRGWEFIEQDDSLYLSRKRGKGTRRSVRRGQDYGVEFTKNAIFEIGTVGITDGVIIHR